MASPNSQVLHISQFLAILVDACHICFEFIGLLKIPFHRSGNLQRNHNYNIINKLKLYVGMSSVLLDLIPQTPKPTQTKSSKQPPKKQKTGHCQSVIASFKSLVQGSSSFDLSGNLRSCLWTWHRGPGSR